MGKIYNRNVSKKVSEKGAVSILKKKIHYYMPNISKEEYNKHREKNLINQLYKGSTKNFIAGFFQSGELIKTDIDDLIMHFQTEDKNT